jgi:hypothetical protein
MSLLFHSGAWRRIAAIPRDSQNISLQFLGHERDTTRQHLFAFGGRERKTAVRIANIMRRGFARARRNVSISTSTTRPSGWSSRL